MGQSRYPPPGPARSAGGVGHHHSFDFGNSRFVGLNEYYDACSDTSRKNDIPEAQFQWLEQDLAANRKPLVWVIGHKPIKCERP